MIKTNHFPAHQLNIKHFDHPKKPSVNITPRLSIKVEEAKEQKFYDSCDNGILASNNFTSSSSCNNRFSSNSGNLFNSPPQCNSTSPPSSTSSMDSCQMATPKTNTSHVNSSSMLPTTQYPGHLSKERQKLPEFRRVAAKRPKKQKVEVCDAVGPQGFSEDLSPSSCETPHHPSGLSYGERCCIENKTMDVQSESGKRKKGTRRGTLNPEAKNVLKAWMFSPEHFAHPYPSEEEKEELAAEAGIEVKQLSNWFTNARKRLWQPVLRQSGVEVKNFLSTGRGGPRGLKLEIPSNIHLLVSQASSPPSSPISMTPRKRPLAIKETESRPVGYTNHSNDQNKKMKENAGANNFHKPAIEKAVLGEWKAKNVSVVHPDSRKDGTVKNGFQESEINAAKSILGLCPKKISQSVH